MCQKAMVGKRRVEEESLITVFPSWKCQRFLI